MVTLERRYGPRRLRDDDDDDDDDDDISLHLSTGDSIKTLEISDESEG